MTPWLTVIGIGDGGLDTLGPEARRALAAASVVFGGRRHLAMLGDTPAETVPWRSPFHDSLADIRAARGRAAVVLATGDPMWFGVGGTLAGVVPAAEMRVLPHPSAFSLAAARLGWPLEEVRTLSAHGGGIEGREIGAVGAALSPGARLLILSENGQTPARLAALLAERGFGASRLVVLEHLGGPKERVRPASTAAAFDLADIADLNLVAVDCAADAPAAAELPRVAGLPDAAFVHDGKMTKRVPRALALAALAPLPGQRLWDIGAGCGSVSVEWARGAPGARALAFEPVEARRAMIRANATALGAPGVEIVAGRAPDCLAGRARPDAVFIGGGLSVAVFEAAWAALGPGGRLAAHVVTLESEAILLDLHARHGGELLRVAVDRAEPVGPFRGWRSAMPVLHWSLAKPAREAAP